MSEKGHESALLHYMSQPASPPAGWFTLGTHVDKLNDPGFELEFWGESLGGEPYWERPKLPELSEQQRTTLAKQLAEEAYDEFREEWLFPQVSGQVKSIAEAAVLKLLAAQDLRESLSPTNHQTPEQNGTASS